MGASILLLPGDGIGPEVIEQARLVLAQVSAAAGGLKISTADFGGAAIEKHGDPLPQATLQAARQADGVLLGAVGAPQFDQLPQDKRPEKGLLRLRQELEVFANLRPARARPALADSSPLRTQLVADLDVLVVRELTGGIYFGSPRGFAGEGEKRCGFNTMRYTVGEINRIAKVAFAAAGRRSGRLCSVDKANVLEVSSLWRETVSALAGDYPQVELSHMYVDNAAMQLAANPGQFDVIVTGNLFGDILSDLAAILAGSIGMLPSASLDAAGRGLYEPVHGSAPDLAGCDQANPCAAILSAAMMLRFSIGAKDVADAIEAAVDKALASGVRTADIAADADQACSCRQMGEAIRENISL